MITIEQILQPLARFLPKSIVAGRWWVGSLSRYGPGRASQTIWRTKKTPHVKLFDEVELARGLEQAGFSVEVASAYGDLQLAPRRIALFATCR